MNGVGSIVGEFEGKLNNFYLDFRQKVKYFKANTIASNTPEGLKYDLDKQIDELIEQSEVYKLNKDLYNSIDPPSS